MIYSKSSQNSIKWLDPVLQGLSFWLGYKRELYRHHLLNEGAIVAELTSLISLKFKSRGIVKCEERYDRIGTNIDNKSRADIFIEINNKPFIVIEVKRIEAGKRLIDFDLVKLAKIKELDSGIRVFLILVSQGKKLKAYINENGESDKKYYPIKGTEYFSYAKRVCKSSSSFRYKSRVNSNYAVLVEVLRKK